MDSTAAIWRLANRELSFSCLTLERQSMVLKRVSLAAVTRCERQSTVDAINMAISESGGWIEDVNFFSNISIAVRSFVPSSNAVDLGTRLAGAGLIVDIEGIDELAMAMRENAPAFELLCQLNVTFFHDEPDLRRTIPSVPG